MDDMVQVVLKQARKTLGKSLDRATADDTLESLGLDSLAVAEVALDLMQRLTITLADEAITSQHTVGQLAEFVRVAVAAKERRTVRARP